MTESQYLRKWKLTIAPSTLDVYSENKGYLSTYSKISEKTMEEFKTSGKVVSKAVDAIEFTDPFKIEFTAAKKALADSDMAEITLWNLSPDLESKLLMEGANITLEAGYENGNYGVIFKGVIIQPIRGKTNGTDYYIKFVCLSEDHFWNLGFIDGVVAVNTKRKELIKQVLRSSYTQNDMQVDESAEIDTNVVDGSNTALERPKILFGNPREIIRNAAKMSNVAAYIEEDQLKFMSFNEELPKTMHSVNVATGMIGSPIQSNEYLTVKVLMNSSIRLGDYIHIDNSKVAIQQMRDIKDITYLLDFDGIYKVVGMTYEGDSRGNAWYTTLQTISKNGKMAAPLTNGKGELLV